MQPGAFVELTVGDRQALGERRRIMRVTPHDLVAVPLDDRPGRR